MILRAKSIHRVAFAGLLASLLVLPSESRAAEPVPLENGDEPQDQDATPRRRGDLPREHDRFFLRLGAGVSADWVSAHASAPVDSTGGGGNFLLAVGGCPVKSLVVTSELSMGMGGFSPSSTYVQIQVGGALYYYFMPANVFIGGGAGYGFASAGRHNMSLLSNRPDPPAYLDGSAVSGHLDVGKEWWVSDRWGIGLGLRGQYTRIVDDRKGQIVSGQLYLSATFN